MAGKQLKLPLPSDGYTVVFRPYITLKNGKRLYAKHYGKRAFPIITRSK